MEIERYIDFNLAQPPPVLSEEELRFFSAMCRRIGLRAVASVMPNNLPDSSVRKLLSMLGNTGDRAINGDFLVGPYIASTEIGYRPDGIMLYEQVREEICDEVQDENPKTLSILRR